MNSKKIDLNEQQGIYLEKIQIWKARQTGKRK